MQPFKPFTGIVMPVDRANVDTDTIIPKQYLKSIARTGFGANLFDDWRYLDPGEPGMDHSQRRANPDCPINQPRYQGAQILLARENFGCGSSREHAVWAFLEQGFRTVIAPSFAEIFQSNAIKNGLLPITLAPEQVSDLFEQIQEQEGYCLRVDLEQCTLTTPEPKSLDFSIPPAARKRLLLGLDDIDLILSYEKSIRAYQERRTGETPWLFPDLADPEETLPP